jgi:hypothetical protein
LPPAEVKRKNEEAELIMKKTTFDDSMFVKKKIPTVLMSKKVDSKKDLYGEDDEE